MATLEKRLVALEAVREKSKSKTVEQVIRAMDAIWARIGTTHSAMLAQYGSEKALVESLRQSLADESCKKSTTTKEKTKQ